MRALPFVIYTTPWSVDRRTFYLHQINMKLKIKNNPNKHIVIDVKLFIL